MADVAVVNTWASEDLTSGSTTSLPLTLTDYAGGPILGFPSWRSGSGLSSVSIGGVACASPNGGIGTILQLGGSNRRLTYFWLKPGLVTEEDPDLVIVTTGSAPSRESVVVAELSGAADTGPDSSDSTDSGGTSTSTAGPLNIPAGGVMQGAGTVMDSTEQVTGPAGPWTNWTVENEADSDLVGSYLESASAAPGTSLVYGVGASPTFSGSYAVTWPAAAGGGETAEPLPLDGAHEASTPISPMPGALSGEHTAAPPLSPMAVGLSGETSAGTPLCVLAVGLSGECSAGLPISPIPVGLVGANVATVAQTEAEPLPLVGVSTANTPICILATGLSGVCSASAPIAALPRGLQGANIASAPLSSFGGARAPIARTVPAPPVSLRRNRIILAAGSKQARRVLASPRSGSGRDARIIP